MGRGRTLVFPTRAPWTLTLDNKIDGALFTLLDIDALKRTEREIRAARDYAEATVRTCPDSLIVLRADMRVDTANDAFYKTFKVSPAETEGRRFMTWAWPVEYSAPARAPGRDHRPSSFSMTSK